MKMVLSVDTIDIFNRHDCFFSSFNTELIRILRTNKHVLLELVQIVFRHMKLPVWFINTEVSCLDRALAHERASLDAIGKLYCSLYQISKGLSVYGQSELVFTLLGELRDQSTKAHLIEKHTEAVRRVYRYFG